MFATLAAWGAGSGSAASNSIIVTARIPSATSLTTTGCAANTPNVTEFGVVQPGSTAVTSADCSLMWGSSNDTSMLRTFQSDGVGTAMGAPSGSWALKSTTDVGLFDAISAADASTAYGSGNGFGVRTTTNGGSSWTTVYPGVTRDVSAAPGTTTTAVAVGDSGGIWRTTTTGGSWPAETSGTAQGLRSVSMVDATNGFAVGASGTVVRRTTVGGSTWTVATPVPGGNLLQGVSAWSTSVVFAVGTNGTIARSGDGAGTWSTAAGCSSTYTDVVAVSATQAFTTALGGRVVRIDWNGTTLTCTGVANVGEDLRGISWDGTWIYVVGVMGTLLRSNDAFSTTPRLLPGTGADLYGVSTPADGSKWVAGTSSTVARAATGTSFSVVRAATTNSTTLTAVAALSDTTAYVAGGQVEGSGTWEAAIRRTTDGGASWTNLDSNTQQALFGIDAVQSSQLVIAVGDDGVVTRSEDGGATFTTQQVAAGVRLWDIDMVDETYGWIVGDGGLILRTTNGGTTWVSQTSPVTSGLRGVSAVDRDVAFATGVSSRVLRTLDGGTWTSLTGIPTTQSLDDITAPTADVVRVVFGYQTTLVSFNASAATPTWAIETNGNGGDGYAIDSAGPSAAMVSLAWNDVTRTRDNAATWQTDSIAGSSYLWGIDVVDENSAWVVGSDNAIFLMQAAPATAFGDYADAGPNWTAGTSLFGACLRDSIGTNVTANWTVDPGCTASGTGVWKGIPATSAAPEAKIAGATSATTARVRLRFGLKVAPAQPPGRYSAGITFEVVAPNA